MSDGRVELKSTGQSGYGGAIHGSRDAIDANITPASPRSPVDVEATSATPSEELPPGYEINDPEFIAQLKQLMALRSFLTKQAIPVTGLPSTGHLNLLRLGKRGEGRFPAAPEWRLLEQNTEALFGLLSEPLRRKFLSSQIPTWLSLTAMVLGGVAVLAFFFGFLLGKNFDHIPFVFLSFLIWASALGATGSIAFIGMNALAVQDDATFDLTNEKLIILRIALGALFGVVLTLTVGFSYFRAYLLELGGESAPTSDTTDVLTRAAIILLPFIFGFSTTLVIMILNRFVEAVQSLFGKGPPPSTTVVVPTRDAATDLAKGQAKS